MLSRREGSSFELPFDCAHEKIRIDKFRQSWELLYSLEIISYVLYNIKVNRLAGVIASFFRKYNEIMERCTHRVILGYIRRKQWD